MIHGIEVTHLDAVTASWSYLTWQMICRQLDAEDHDVELGAVISSLDSKFTKLLVDLLDCAVACKTHVGIVFLGIDWTTHALDVNYSHTRALHVSTASIEYMLLI
jgi:hypothetical protein